MEKTIKINGTPVQFKCTGAFLLRYRQLLNQDPIKEISKIDQKFNKQEKGEGGEKQEISLEDMSLEDLDVLYNIIWVMAKTADPEIPELIDWLDTFDEFSIVDVFTEIKPLIDSAFRSNIKNKRVQKKTVPIKK